MSEEPPEEVVRCAALGCVNGSNSDLALFFLPSEPKLKTLWETNIGRNDLPLSSVVCEAHFSPGDIVNEGKVKTLKYDAVPSMFGVKSDDENDNVRRSARKKNNKKTGSGVLLAKGTARRNLTKVEIGEPTKQPLEKKGKKNSVGSQNEAAKPQAGDKKFAGKLRRASRKKVNSECESESINDKSTDPHASNMVHREKLKRKKTIFQDPPEIKSVSTNETSTNTAARDKGSGKKVKLNRRKRAIDTGPPKEDESTSERPELRSLNGTDERGHAIAEWYLLDVFEATKMISSVLKTGTMITESLVSNVEETIIDVISKLLQRISSVIITSLEEEFNFHSDIKKILADLDKSVLEDVEKMLEFDQEKNNVPEVSLETREENYADMLKRMDPNAKDEKEQKVYEEVISPVNEDYSVLTEHAYFREEQRPKGKKAMRENRSAQVLQCGFCKFETKIKSKLRRHMRKHLTNKVYNCPLCGYTTKSEESLQKHYRTHSGAKPYACAECSFKTANRSNLTRHMLIHKGEKPFQCPLCSHATRQKVSLESHMKCHDPSSTKEPSVYVCGECSFVTISRQEFNSHIQEHQELKEHQAGPREIKHECKICDTICHSAEALRAHLETHVSSVEYVCDICAYKTNKYAYYNRHVACHSGLRPFKCEYCSQTFRMNAHLMAHVRRHEIGPYCKRSSM